MAAADHALSRTRATLKTLGNHRLALLPPGAPTPDWLDRTFERMGLKEVAVTGAAMRHRLVATYRANGLLSLKARRLIALFDEFREQA